MEVVAALSQGRTAAAQCGLFTYKSVPVIFEPPCIYIYIYIYICVYICMYVYIYIYIVNGKKLGLRIDFSTFQSTVPALV